jgi:hypothetical protein
MAERRDINTLAKFIVDQATGERPIKRRTPAMANRGTARAAALTPERRKEIAKRAAASRWEKTRRDSEKPSGD